MYKNVKQRSIADCGAACMATIAETYGVHISLDKMRELAHTDRQGNNLRGLIEAAKALGFEADPVMGDSEALLTESFPLPAVVQITSAEGSSHYVVLHRISSHGVVIADPASKTAKAPMAEFLEMWSGVMLLVHPGEHFRKERRSPGALRTIAGLAGRQKKFFAVIALFSLTASFLGIAASGVYRILIDQVIPQKEHELVFIVCTSVIIIYFLRTILEYSRGRCMIALSARIDDSIVTKFISHIMRLPMNFFSSYRSGEIFSRISDASKVRDALSSAVLTVLVDCVMAAAAGAVICTISPSLFAASLSVASVYGILAVIFSRSVRRKSERQAEDEARFTACTLETIDCAETAKAFGAEHIFSDKSSHSFRTFLSSIKNLERTGNLQSSLTSAAACMGNILLLMLGADMVIHDTLTLGVFFQFTAMLAYFLDPVKNILGVQSALQSAAVSARRLSGMLELRPEGSEDIKYAENAVSKGIGECSESMDTPSAASFDLSGAIAIRDLCFRYGSRETILENADLTIRAGSKTALVGASGCGKSTLAKILMRFYDYESGEIFIGGTDLRRISRRELRRKIAYVSQDIQLFTGSIRDNLKIAASEASDEEILTACRSANIYDLISDLPGGLDYILDEKGTNLSVGERQRLCIARAFLRSPDILILDEATSNLDTISEQVIWDSITSMENVTVICIAHRLSSVCRCDEIFVIDDKKFTEHGTHRELITKKSGYYRLWTAQAQM